MLGPRHELRDAALGELQAIGERGHRGLLGQVGRALDLQEEQVPRGRDPAVARDDLRLALEPPERDAELGDRAASSAVGEGLPGRSPRAADRKAVAASMCRCPGSSTQSSRSSTSSPRSRPCRSRSRSSATSAGSRPGAERGGTSWPRPTPSPRSGGATSSARTRPASGRTRCCPGAGETCCGSTSRGTGSRARRIRRSPRACSPRRSSTQRSGCYSSPGRCRPVCSPGRACSRTWRASTGSGSSTTLVVRPGSSSWSSSSRRSSRSPGSARSRTSGRGCARDSRSFANPVATCGRSWRGRRSTGSSAWRRSTSPSAPSGCRRTFHSVFVVQVAQTLSTLLPLTPAGIGTEQALLVYMFAGTAPASDVLSFSVGLKIVVIAVNLTLGTIATLATLRSFPWQVDVDKEAAERCLAFDSASNSLLLARVGPGGASGSALRPTK